MPAILMLLAAIAAADAPPSQPNATQPAALESPASARERATNEALLAALRQKRSEIARSPLAADDERHLEARRYALDFLDRQIAKLQVEVGR